MKAADAVQGVGLHAVLAHVAAGDVPPLFEYFQEVRLKLDAHGGDGAGVGEIVEHHDAVLAQGINHRGKILARRGHVFKENASGQVARIAEHLVGGGGVHEPLGHLAAHAGILVDVVFVGARVAFDFNLEQLLHGLAVVVERASGHAASAVRQPRTLPAIVELAASDAAIAADGVHQPDISVQ